MVVRDEEHVRHRFPTPGALREHVDSLRYGRAQRRYPEASGVWLWRDFILPGFPEEHIISLKEGQTDLFEVPEWLGRDVGLPNLFLKMEGQGPSESFKDRGMTVAASEALRLQAAYPGLGLRGLACASTGDTSAAAAVYAAYAREQLSCVVLVPHEEVAEAQLFQAMAHGAQVRAVRHEDGFDGAMALVQEFCDHHPELVLVNSKNDMRLVGQETIALEVLQDLAWRAPDWMVVPVGNGGNLTALLCALSRAHGAGLIDRLPGVIGAQTEAADTLVRWQESGCSDYSPGPHRQTVASAMNINSPVSFPRIESLMGEFDLRFIRASESEVKDTWAQFLGAGANICPQSAVALAAAKRARSDGVLREEDVVVSIATASAVKFSGAGLAYHGEDCLLSNPFEVVDADMEALDVSLGLRPHEGPRA
jgi:threonine synthase